MPTATIAYALAVALAAGTLRGFTGFGFALAAVPALTLVLEPREVIPAALLLQIAAGAHLVPKTYPQADRPAVFRLLIGALLGTPLGVVLLGWLSQGLMRAAIGLVVLVATAILWRGNRFAPDDSATTKLCVGLLSGALNSATAMGGPPVILYFLSGDRTAEQARASLHLYFVVLSVGSAIAAASTGLVGAGSIRLAATMLAPLLIGNHLGDRAFDRARPEAYRQIALGFLCLLGIAAIARSALG